MAGEPPDGDTLRRPPPSGMSEPARNMDGRQPLVRRALVPLRGLWTGHELSSSLFRSHSDASVAVRAIGAAS